MAITIDRDQRDAMYRQIVLDLNGLTDLWTEFSDGNYDRAKELRQRFVFEPAPALGARNAGAVGPRRALAGRRRLRAGRDVMASAQTPRPRQAAQESGVRSVCLRSATSSIFHQRHIGRMLRPPCNIRGRGDTSSRDEESRPGRRSPLRPGDLRDDGVSLAAAGADGSDA